MPQEVYEPPRHAQGVVPQLQYTPGAHYPSPYPPLTQGAQPDELQKQAFEQWKAVQSATQMTNLQAPELRPRPQDIAPNALQPSPLGVPASWSATTGPSLYSPYQHRRAPNFPSAPTGMQRPSIFPVLTNFGDPSGSSSPTNWGNASSSAHNWEYASSSVHKHSTNVPMRGTQNGQNDHHPLPPNPTSFMAPTPRYPTNGGQLSQPTQFQMATTGAEMGVNLMQGVGYNRPLYDQQFSMALPSQQPAYQAVSSHQGQSLINTHPSKKTKTEPDKRTKRKASATKCRKTTHVTPPLPPAYKVPPERRTEEPATSGSVRHLPTGQPIYKPAALFELEQRRQIQNNTIADFISNGGQTRGPPSTATAGIETPRQDNVLTNGLLPLVQPLNRQEEIASKRKAEQPKSIVPEKTKISEQALKCRPRGQEFLRHSDDINQEKKHNVERPPPLKKRKIATPRPSIPVTRRPSVLLSKPAATGPGTGPSGSHQQHYPPNVGINPSNGSASEPPFWLQEVITAASPSLKPPLFANATTSRTGVAIPKAHVTPQAQIAPVAHTGWPVPLPSASPPQTPTVVPRTPILLNQSEMTVTQQPITINSPQTTVIGTPTHSPISISASPIPSISSPPSEPIRVITKPLVPHATYFPPGGRWTQDNRNGQVKRSKPFTIRDVLGAARAMHIVERSPELKSRLGR